MNFVFGGFGSFGTIGLMYYSIGGWILAHILFFIFTALAIIGAFTVLKWLFTGKKKKD